MSEFMQTLPVGVAVLTALFGAALLAGLVGLTLYGASLFGVRTTVAKTAVACLATYSAASLAIYGIGPVLMRMAGGATPVISSIMMALIFFGIPPLILAFCLRTTSDMNEKEGWATSLFGFGAYTAVSALLLLVVSALIPSDIQRLPLVGGAYETFKNLVWLMLVIGGALAFGGYIIGSGLGARSAQGPASEINEFEPINHAPMASTPIIPAPSGTISNDDTQLGRATAVAGAPGTLSNGASHRFLVLNGQGGTTRYDLNEGEIKIGRIQTCAIKVANDDEVSREHALLRITRDKVVLSDLSARNGTFLNGDRVQAPRALQDGDQIRIGSSTLVFKQA